MYSIDLPDRPLPLKPFLSLTLTPLQLPQTPLAVASSWQQPDRSTVVHPEMIPRLRICPGEPSQLLVQIHNHNAQGWDIRLAVSSSIPQSWCEIPDQPGSLAGKDRSQGDGDITTEAELLFRVPADFFERQDALQPNNQPLKIDYGGQVQVYARPSNSPEAEESLMATAPFRIMLRSHSRYLDYLPQVYQEVDFMGRLLKLFEQSFDPSVETLKLLWAYLDPRTASMQLLPFLAHWVGWPTDFPWESASPSQLKRQRQLIFNAMTLYRWRGTQRGLRHYLHLYTGLPETETHISIENAFKPGFELGNARLDETTIIGGGRPYHFVVSLKEHLPQVSSQDLLDQTEIIHKIVCQEKPAFCTYTLYIEDAASS